MSFELEKSVGESCKFCYAFSDVWDSKPCFNGELSLMLANSFM